MATYRGFTGWRSISKVEEAAYDTAATIAATYRNAADPMNLVVELADSTELVGSAAEEVNDQEIMALHSEGAETLPRLRPNEAALFLAFFFGNLNQSPANEPAANYYTHTITPRPVTFTTSAQDGSVVPLTTIAVEDTSSWPATGTLYVEASGNTWTYGGKTATSFTTVNSCNDNLANNTALHLKQPDYDYLLPSFTVLDYIGAALKKQWPGCLLQSLGIAGERKGFVRLTAQIVGSGTTTSPATARPAEVTEVYLKVGDATVTRGGTWNGTVFSGGTSINAACRSFDWSVSQDIPDDLVYLMGGSTKMGRGERLRRSQTLKMVLEFNSDTEKAFVLDQTNMNFQINLAGATGSYAVKLIFPSITFKGIQMTGETGVLVETMDASVFHHTTYGSMFAQVINKQVDYLHA